MSIHKGCAGEQTFLKTHSQTGNRPGNPSVVRNSEDSVKTGENTGGAVNGLWLKSYVAKFALLIEFYECSFHKIKIKLSKYCHMGLKCSLLLLNEAQRSMGGLFIGVPPSMYSLNTILTACMKM